MIGIEHSSSGKQYLFLATKSSLDPLYFFFFNNYVIANKIWPRSKSQSDMGRKATLLADKMWHLDSLALLNINVLLTKEGSPKGNDLKR